MKTLKIAVAALALTGFAGAAQAQDAGHWYMNLGADTYEFDAFGIGGKLGYNFNEWFGAEGQGSIGLIDDEKTIGGMDFDFGYDYMIAGFGVVRYPLSPNFEVFGRAGYQLTEVSIDADDAAGEAILDAADIDESVDGFAAGAGIQYMWDGLNGVRVEYTYLDGNDGLEADTGSISYVRKF